MKKNFTIFFTVLLLLAFSITAFGQRTLITATAMSGPGWNQPTNWVTATGEHRAPMDNDSIVIPAGKKIIIGYAGFSNTTRILTNVIIDVFGELQLGRASANVPSLDSNNFYIRTTTSAKIPVIRIANNAMLTTENVPGGGVSNIFVIENGNPDSIQMKYTTRTEAEVGLPQPPGQAYRDTIKGLAAAYNTFGPQQQPRYFVFLPSVLLPVSISAFTAAVSSNTVVLNWTSQQELNSKVFLIERSNDGNSNWQQIGAVQAAGQSSIASNYKFEDNTASAINYYRLGLADANGTITLSKTLLVRLKNTGVNITLFPNPAVNNVSISVDNVGLVQQGFSLHISNEKGQLVAQQKIAKGTNIVSFDLTSYKAGIYTMNILFANGIQETHKLVVAK